MSRRIVLIGLSGVLVVVVGLAVWFTINPPTPKEEELTESNEEEQRVEISRFELDLIKEMVLDSPNGHLRLMKEGEGWLVDQPYQVEMDPSAVDDLTYSFARLYSEKIIEKDAADLSIYGLAPPLATARVSLTDGTERVFHLGSRTPARNTYYLKPADDSTVYAVWMNHGEHFQWVLDDLRERDLGTIDPQKVKRLRLIRSNGQTIELLALKEKDEDEVRFNLGFYQMTQPYSEPYGVDTEDLNEYLGSLPAFKIAEFVADNVTDFSPYGLDDPRVDFYVEDEETSIHLLFGQTKDDNYVYFRPAGSTSVYTMATDQLGFVAMDAFKLVDKFAFIVNIDYVEEVSFTSPAASVTLGLTRKGEGDNVETTYLSDGKEVEEDPFKKLYQSFIGMFIEAENTPPKNGRPTVRLQYRLNTGRIRTWTIEYAPYDADFYEVYINGKTEFLMSATQVNNMVADVVKYRKEHM